MGSTGQGTVPGAICPQEGVNLLMTPLLSHPGMLLADTWAFLRFPTLGRMVVAGHPSLWAGKMLKKAIPVLSPWAEPRTGPRQVPAGGTAEAPGCVSCILTGFMISTGHG